MKRFVDGEALEFPDSGFEIREGVDRLYVRTPQGIFSGLAIKQGDRTLVSYKGNQYEIERKLPRRKVHHASGGELRAPMPGLVVDVMAKVGDNLQKGQKILVLEAMKTQQPFHAPFEGVLAQLLVSKNDQVQEGVILAVVEEKS